MSNLIRDETEEEPKALRRRTFSDLAISIRQEKN